jgi:hypothetical protein
MESEIVYQEMQGFKQTWLRFILPVTLAVSLLIFIFQVITRQAYLRDALFATIVIALISFYLFSIRMETLIKTDGIYVRYSPFHRQYQFFPWKSIQTISIRKYHPMLEYGGWGIRFGIFGRGKAYNVSGTIGIQLVFHNGSRLLIGTKAPREVTAALNRLGKLHYFDI